MPYAFKDPASAAFFKERKHGAEMAGIARWLRQAGESEQALTLFRRAVDAGLPDDLLFRTLWDIGQLERKLDVDPVATWTDLAQSRNPYRVDAIEELAKHFEHRVKDYPRALQLTQQAMDLEESPGLRRREERLRRRLTNQAPRKKGASKRGTRS